jgi:hypothetical protein
VLPEEFVETACFGQPGGDLRLLPGGLAVIGIDKPSLKDGRTHSQLVVLVGDHLQEGVRLRKSSDGRPLKGNQLMLFPFLLLNFVVSDKFMLLYFSHESCVL